VLAAEAAALSSKPVEAPSVGDLCAEAGFDVVINATSASQSGALPAIAPGVFATGCLAYEMVYGRGLTPFLRLAQAAGAQRLADGVGMLVEQAAEAFAWWRGVWPETSAVIAEISVPLA